MTTQVYEALATDNKTLKRIGNNVMEGLRINPDEGIYLFEHGTLAWLGALANHVREKMHGNNTYFNRNFHIEPTNVCVFSCKFCSYSRLYAHKEEGWELSTDQMLDESLQGVDRTGAAVLADAIEHN